MLGRDRPCQLHLALDRPEPTYQLGEEIAGHVEVSATQEMECRGVRLTLRWRTEGWSNTDKGKKHSHELSGPTHLASGESQRFDFALATPPGPVTHRGKNFQLAWQLELRVDLPRRRDITLQREVTLVPGHPTSTPDLGPKFSHRRRHRTRKTATYWAAVAVGMVPLGFGVWPYLTTATHGWLHYGALLAGGVLSVFGLRGLAARRRLGRIDLQFDRDRVRRGEQLPFSLRIAPRGDLEVQHIAATLRAEEWARKGAGQHSSVRTSQAYAERITLASDQVLDHRRPFELSASFALPADAPCTFVAGENKLRWWLKIEVAIAGWPDWSAEYPVVVSP